MEKFQIKTAEAKSIPCTLWMKEWITDIPPLISASTSGKTTNFISCFGTNIQVVQNLKKKKTKHKKLKVGEVTKTKAFMRKGGSSVCRGWQMLRPDWPVPARMGFAVNRSQLVQSEWKETAQKGYFVPLFVKLEAKTKHNRQLFSRSPLESMGAN